MRTREEIEDVGFVLFEKTKSGEALMGRLLLEVLLDIRTLLTKDRK